MGKVLFLSPSTQEKNTTNLTEFWFTQNAYLNAKVIKRSLGGSSHFICRDFIHVSKLANRSVKISLSFIQFLFFWKLKVLYRAIFSSYDHFWEFWDVQHLWIQNVLLNTLRLSLETNNVSMFQFFHPRYIMQPEVKLADSYYEIKLRTTLQG